jgi:hypothetical protein
VTYLQGVVLRANQGVSIFAAVQMLTPETDRLQWTTMFFRRGQGPSHTSSAERTSTTPCRELRG